MNSDSRLPRSRFSKKPNETFASQGSTALKSSASLLRIAVLNLYEWYSSLMENFATRLSKMKLFSELSTPDMGFSPYHVDTERQQWHSQSQRVWV